MSLLEIILLVIGAIALITWCTIIIVKSVKNKKKPNKEEEGEKYE